MAGKSNNASVDLRYGAQYTDTNPAIGAYQVVSAAANVNGCMVFAASLDWSPTATGTCINSVVAKATTPTSATDGTVLALMPVSQNNGSYTGCGAQMCVEVPPGVGVYIWSGGSQGTIISKRCVYKLK